MPRLDQNSAGVLQYLREDDYLLAHVLSSLHALQPHSSQRGATTLLCRWLFLGSSRAARQRSRSRSRPIHAPPLVSGSGFFSAAFFVLTTNDPEDRSLDAWGRGSSPRRVTVVLAHRFPVSAPLLAAADLNKNLVPPTILAWECCLPSFTLDLEGTPTHERGFGTAQTAYFVAGVLATPQLDATPRRIATGVCGTLPFACRNPTFVLCECTQESVLLPRLPARR